MLAIHNADASDGLLTKVANAFAKLSKCQQFTTATALSHSLLLLQTLLQSYQNVSNSQLSVSKPNLTNCCKRFCKVIKMLAIHNQNLHTQEYSKVANAFAKLSKCQQFTTTDGIAKYDKQLQTLLQSYQNVSNSQPAACSSASFFCCKRFCKVIKMLAIHNRQTIKFFTLTVANAFAKLSKCQQFTTVTCSIIFLATLQTLLQSYQNVSNSQRNKRYQHYAESCKRFCKVIKMLAIHN